MPAGSIVIDLLMKTGSFETDTKRAEKNLKELQKTANLAGVAIGAGISAAVIGAVAAFDQLNKSAGDFQDLAEEIGDTAENVASLAIAAGTAGVGLESIVNASAKMSKSLVGVNDESKAAGAALKAIGIEVEAFKKLSPVEQYEAVGKALGNYADGASKVAVAQTLFGRAGEQQLRVFKALEEAGGRQVILTQEQITLADAYADAQSRNGALLKLYGQAISTQLLPAYNDLVTVSLQVVQSLLGIENAGDKLAKNNSIKEFGDSVANTVAFVVDQFDLISRLFESGGKGIGAYFASLTLLLKGDIKGAIAIAKEGIADVDEVFKRSTFGDKLRAQQAARRAAEANPASYSNEGRAPTRIGIDFNGAVKPDKAAKEKQSDAEKYSEQLRNQLQGVQELSTYEKLLDDIQKGKLKTATDAEIVTLRNQAVQIDGLKRLAEQRKADNDALTESNKKVQKNYEDAQQLMQAVETPAEKLRRELEAINVAAAQNPFVTQETAARSAVAAWDRYSEAIKKANEETNTFAQQAAANIQDAFGDTMQRAFEGNLKGIGEMWRQLIVRMVAQAAAANLGKQLFGADYGKTGNIGGLLGQAGAWLGGKFGGGNTNGIVQQYGDIDGYAEGGRPPVGAVSVVGEMGPELFVPNTAGRIIPNDALGGGGDVTIVNPPGMPLQVQKHQTRDSDGKMAKKFVLSTILQDANSGGPAVRTYANNFGTQRQLVRRGRG